MLTGSTGSIYWDSRFKPLTPMHLARARATVINNHTPSRAEPNQAVTLITHSTTRSYYQQLASTVEESEPRMASPKPSSAALLLLAAAAVLALARADLTHDNCVKNKKVTVRNLCSHAEFPPSRYAGGRALARARRHPGGVPRRRLPTWPQTRCPGSASRSPSRRR